MSELEQFRLEKWGSITSPIIDEGYIIPFVGATAPADTYAEGRYLEPYCACNDRWSCRLSPPENRLNVGIEAGEKKFHD